MSDRKHFFIVVLFVLVGPRCVLGVPDMAPLQNNPPRHYVTIGAFRLLNNANRYADHVGDKHGLPATVGWQSKKQLYFVYTLKSGQWNEAWPAAKKLRATATFHDAWVYIGHLDGLVDAAPAQTTDARTANADTPASPLPEGTEEQPKPTPPSQPSDTPGNANMAAIPPNNGEPGPTEVEAMAENPISVAPKTAGLAPADSTMQAMPPPMVLKPGEHLMYFNTYGIENYRELKGKVSVVDLVRAKKMRDYNTHQLVKVNDPKNGHHKIKAVAQVFGYRPVEYVVDLEAPVQDSTAEYTQVAGDTIILDFELQRYRKGDIIVMYNVYFHRDAAVMRSDSQYELNQLLSMLNSSPDMRVKIHGHTNGGAVGKIIAPNKDSNSFFNMRGDVLETIGTARDLSMKRAQTIKRYLEYRGIATERLETKAWGGKRMLHDKHGNSAKKNVRVEIEILDD